MTTAIRPFESSISCRYAEMVDEKDFASKSKNPVFSLLGSSCEFSVEASPERQKNFMVAENIRQHVKSLGIFSPNFPARYYVDHGCCYSLEDFYERCLNPFWDRTADLIVKCLGLFKGNSGAAIPDFEDLAKAVEAARCGDCFGMSIASYIYALKQYGESFHFSITGLRNHFFLIVGAPRKEADTAALQDDDFICDTWAGSIFPASHPEHLMDFMGTQFCQSFSYMRTFVTPWTNPFVFHGSKHQDLPAQRT